MDHNLTQRRRGLEDKIPDIKKTLGMIEFLQERRVSLRHALRMSRGLECSREAFRKERSRLKTTKTT